MALVIYVMSFIVKTWVSYMYIHTINICRERERETERERQREADREG